MAYKIMVVDDSLPMRAVIIKTIKASGFTGAHFFQAENGIEALKVMKKEWLDIVLTDYNMPDMNGLELIGEMKKDDLMSSIPVIVITTEGSRKKVDAFLEEGAAGYIKKPFTPEEIREQLIQILGEEKNEDEFENNDDGLDF